MSHQFERETLTQVRRKDLLFGCVKQWLIEDVIKLIDEEERGQIIDTGLIDRVKDAFLEMGFDFNTEANSLSVYLNSLTRDFRNSKLN